MSKKLLIIVNVITVILFTAAAIFVTLNKEDNSEQLPAMSSNEYTASNIEQHKTPSDCWVAIGGSVYDFSEYFVSNPDENLSSQMCGKIEPNITLPKSLKKDKLLGYRIGLLTP